MLTGGSATGLIISPHRLGLVDHDALAACASPALPALADPFVTTPDVQRERAGFSLATVSRTSRAAAPARLGLGRLDQRRADALPAPRLGHDEARDVGFARRRGRR